MEGLETAVDLRLQQHRWQEAAGSGERNLRELLWKSISSAQVVHESPRQPPSRSARGCTSQRWCDPPCRRRRADVSQARRDLDRGVRVIRQCSRPDSTMHRPSRPLPLCRLRSRVVLPLVGSCLPSSLRGRHDVGRSVYCIESARSRETIPVPLPSPQALDPAQLTSCGGVQRSQNCARCLSQ